MSSIEVKSDESPEPETLPILSEKTTTDLTANENVSISEPTLVPKENRILSCP